ncbi:tripartite tricarboxylate transporter substrate-binding protein [Pigmentiphaga sp.]|uniref:Bug family tripartite tricarboxylate transporter substrate binding protein n=1 Tax=Pigmentiphaga sp. TaxID=1977564 RepID=UPI00128CB18B|nr:tripartite tricarboxylate transporter substrate-binding protein [Pigmentiphaga sp.]MPS29448.1 tripartite tricarboxylate transporter substrate binding protein [Alcaligenaceae bacterium SAGV5]MPS55408.1 tripartite tricarboxylate transporter substrate binding protein [Alcaligenaceae bacterium SAGV3]MPT60099.1 tripartite tricarboxylate transporter substrate binding protein [Alcaligenaceae bacterium]
MWLQKRVLSLVCGISLAAATIPVQASDFPSRPIKILIGFSAGGSTDAVARYYALKMGEALKSPVVVENKPGASQLVAIRGTTSARPDGYTLFLATGSSLSQGPGVRTDLPYDPLKDFEFVALAASAPGAIIASPKIPAKTIDELLQYGRDNPDKLNYGSSGVGSASHLQTEYLLNAGHSHAIHIPYKADAEIMNAIAEGSVHFGLGPLQGAVPQILNGKVRGIAITGSQRSKAIPDVPALSESKTPGLGGVDPYTYYGLLAPRGTPSDVIAKLNAAVNAVSRDPDAIKYLQDKFFDPQVSTPESFKKFVTEDIAKWQGFRSKINLSN